MMNGAAKPQISAGEIGKRKHRWVEFLKPNAEPGFRFYVRYDDPDAGLPSAVPSWPDKRKERVEYKWACYQHELERAAWIQDDCVPAINMMTGTEIFAEAFGCDVHYPEDSNPFALPLIHSAAEAGKLKVPELSESSLAYLFEMADELQRRGGPDALFRTVDVQSPIDIAALIWEKSSFYMALVEEGEAVRHLAGKVHELLTAFFDEWFGRYGTEYVAHYPDYFMSGGLTLSEDEVGVVDAGTFVELFLPELVALSERYGGLGMHCCADARHQWGNFKMIPGLRLLNLVNPPTRDPEQYIKPGYEFFSDHCVQWHSGWNPDGPIEAWPGKFPKGSRVVIDTTAESREQAVDLCEKLNSARERLYG